MQRRKMAGLRPGTMLSSTLVLLTVLTAVVPQAAAAAPTTSITLRKLASDGSTVLAQRTVDYRWLMDPDNIPVLGDGATHYFHQGPVFIDHPDESTEEALRWNPAEDTNIETKDMGALKGTNVKDLCGLVGGMAAGDKLRIRASDGLSKTFAYKNVYQYSDREGPMVICWYKDGQYPDSGFSEGMRLVWFADTSTNPWKMHVFGNWDWHEAADEEYWYYFRNGNERYPTTTGLSIQSVTELIIYSAQPASEASAAPVAESAADMISGNDPAPATQAPAGTSAEGQPEATRAETAPVETTLVETTPADATAAETTSGEAAPPETMHPVSHQRDASRYVLPAAIATVAIAIAVMGAAMHSGRRGRS